MLSSIASKVILGLLLLLALAGAGIWLEEGRISKLNQTIGSDTQAIASLRAGVAAQDKAIADEQAIAAQREKAAADAVDAAQSDAKQARATAASIMAQRAPKGSYDTQCRAASKAFDDELQGERRK